MIALYVLIATAFYWLVDYFQTAPSGRDRFFRRSVIVSHLDTERMNEDEMAKPAFFKHRKKPRWVIDKVIYLKAVSPLFGCRKLADLFNRIHAQKHNMTVSKSYVYYTLRKHRYEVQVLRRMIKHRRPKSLGCNICWGIDLTTVSDQNGNLLLVFVAVDYGTRRCIVINSIKSKHSFVLLYHLFKAIAQCGKPKSIKTDNEAVFTSFTFKSALALMGIKHQTSDIASPWQNGRVERLIGTFKEKVCRILVRDQAHLIYLLPQFQLWYNQVRPHSILMVVHPWRPGTGWMCSIPGINGLIGLKTGVVC